MHLTLMTLNFVEDVVEVVLVEDGKMTSLQRLNVHCAFVSMIEECLFAKRGSITQNLDDFFLQNLCVGLSQPRGGFKFTLIVIEFRNPIFVIFTVSKYFHLTPQSDPKIIALRTLLDEDLSFGNKLVSQMSTALVVSLLLVIVLVEFLEELDTLSALEQHIDVQGSSIFKILHGNLSVGSVCSTFMAMMRFLSGADALIRESLAIYFNFNLSRINNS